MAGYLHSKSKDGGKAEQGGQSAATEGGQGRGKEAEEGAAGPGRAAGISSIESGIHATVFAGAEVAPTTRVARAPTFTDRAAEE